MIALLGVAAAMGGPQVYGMLRLDSLEVQPLTSAVTWSADGFVGGDVHRLWARSEGTWQGAVHNQLLVSRLVSPWWEVQAGAQVDVEDGVLVPWGVIGLEGLAPYWFEVTPQLRVGPAGVQAGLTAERDVFITQRLILNVGGDVDAGTVEVAAGGDVTLRYEIRRELAPTVGVAADWSRADGFQRPTPTLGLRAWF